MQRTIHMSYADAERVVYALRALADDAECREWEVSPKSVRDVTDKFLVSMREAYDLYIHEALLRDVRWPVGRVSLKITSDDAGIAMIALIAKVRSLGLSQAARIMRAVGGRD